jgi:hypothetical protein
MGRQPFERVLGQAAVRCQLAAEDRQGRRAGLVELEDIIAGDGVGAAGVVVI